MAAEYAILMSTTALLVGVSISLAESISGESDERSFLPR
jgi:hypothetical protein